MQFIQLSSLQRSSLNPSEIQHFSAADRESSRECLVLSYRLESAACTSCCFNNRQNSASRKCQVLIYRLESAACTICCLNNRQNSASRECLVSIYRLEQRLVQFAKLNNRQIQRETINIKIVKNSDCRLPCPEKS